MLSSLDSTLLSDSNPTNFIRSVLRNTADIIIVILDLPPREIKEPNTRGIKEPNLDRTKRILISVISVISVFNIVYFIKRFHLFGQDKDVYNLRKIVTYFL